MRHMLSQKPYLDMALIVALQEELDAVLEVLKFKTDLTIDDFQITECVSPNRAVRVCIVKQHEMGHSAARAACEHLLSHYRIGIVCSFGIAGGLSTDLHLGDICISQTVYDLTDNAKYVDSNNHVDVQFSPTPYHVDRGLCSRLAFLTQNPALSTIRSLWLSQCKSHFEQPDVQNILSVLESTFEIPASPSVHFGSLASGSVIASNALKEKLQLVDRKILAIETECSGVFEIAQRFSGVLFFAIRAISDYADSNKSSLEAQTKCTVRALAVKNAAEYLFHQLNNDHFVNYLTAHRNSSEAHEPMPSVGRTRRIDKIFAQAELDVERNLRESCPAYRTKSKGYVLPPPRISPVRSKEPFEEERSPRIQEIAIAVEKYDRILISLEFTYPDNALCWVIADHILRTNGDRLFVPSVIDGSQVKVGRFNLTPQEEILDEETTPIIILDNPDIRSRRHMDCLIKEAGRHPGCKFIIISRDNNFTVDVGDFLSLFDCELFHSASFSLASLSYFISSNFDMLPRQADYTAVRLWEVFEKFNMHAHPSYFAGISQDMLHALITANRRGELIQLAVQGALMLLVASDKDVLDRQDVAVSRTFRERFLTDVIVCQDILKEPVTEERAIGLVKELAEKYDLDISPSRFVASFIDIGLLSFDNRGVNFTASYVRDYLLAEFLVSDPQEANAYFNMDQMRVDLKVMDIYAEIGPDARLVERVIEIIGADIALLDKERPETRGVLFDDRPQPRMLRKPAGARAKKMSVEKAVQYVGENVSDLERKQNILDFRNMVVARVVEHKHKTQGDAEGGGIPVEQILLHWRVGCALLGGGAEQISRIPKRRLAQLLIRLANRIAEVFTAELDEIDFEVLKQSFMSSERYVEMEEKLDSSERYKAREDLQRVIDLLEYELTSLPYKAVLYSLCGTGWENTLRMSVRECELTNPFDKLTRAVWVSDLQPGLAKEVCEGTFSELGRAGLLRCVLADHFVSRVYWDKWKVDERSKMLDLACDIIQPLGVSFKKGEISRAAKINARKRRKIRKKRK